MVDSVVGLQTPATRQSPFILGDNPEFHPAYRIALQCIRNKYLYQGKALRFHPQLQKTGCVRYFFRISKLKPGYKYIVVDKALTCSISTVFPMGANSIPLLEVGGLIVHRG